MPKILVIGTVWPEPNSTAAGNRMLQIIEQFQNQLFEVVFSCSAAKGEFSFDLESIAAETFAIELNNSNFDDFILELNPDIVIFDRFMIEEQFGWRVAENLPNCLRILDTEDLHFVRKTRFECFNIKKSVERNDYLNSELAKREIASIFRCDISLIISEVEMEILTSIFKIDSRILLYVPFLLDSISQYDIDSFPSFAKRKHFITIGNFRHEPNWNSVLYLKETIWPLIKKQLPDSELHIYGSYVTQKAMNLNNVKEGFLVKGRAENAYDVIKKARVLLAPIRFGAGIKGKLTDAMICGTPSVTTIEGAESMVENGSSSSIRNWNGEITNNAIDFANAAIALYLNENLWSTAQKNGMNIVNNRFDKTYFGKKLIDTILETKNNLQYHRTHNFIGEMLQMQTLKSTKYMSKWIEEKSRGEQRS